MNKTIAQQLGVTDFPFKIKDKEGRTIYYENVNNEWEREEYDSYGNQKYFENSDGYSVEWEYDSDGNEIYYKNSLGDLRDNRHK